ncbi:MAG: hypothetical protein IH611_03245 [Deltaproteobacteria bacterium]|nr:hypothetical protein [Deltaproteobacteria bacterium]
MRAADIHVRNGRWAATAALVGLLVLFTGPGCGKKEGGGSPAGGPGPSPSESAVPGKSAVPAAGRHEVDLDHLISCRITPPGITVKPSPGHVREVTEVRWYVNGAEGETGPRLSPSAFRRGDRIFAAVTLRVDGAETLATTREVLAGNSPPSVTVARIEPANPVSGGAVRAFAEGSDADGDAVRIRYEWYVDNVLIFGNDEKVVLKGIRRGSTLHVKATPNDGIVNGAWQETPRFMVVNGLPVVTSKVPEEMPADGRFIYRIAAEDPDGDPLTYSLKKGPPGMALNGSTLEWQVPAASHGRPIEVVVEISDGQGGTTVQNISMTIQPPRQPQAVAP